ncbi:MAG: DUF1249 domain-containing protein [Candidatus Competibacterales bacterium]
MITTADSHIHQALGNVPLTFASLMDLYERNYIGMRRLVPDLPASGTALVSRVSRGLDLHLFVNERFRYTSELVLTYRFGRGDTVCCQPDLAVRIYHDARLAEVQAARLRHWPAFVLAEGMTDQSQLQARWHVNRFLYKWLNYCLNQGHRFDADKMGQLPEGFRVPPRPKP